MLRRDVAARAMGKACGSFLGRWRAMLWSVHVGKL